MAEALKRLQAETDLEIVFSEGLVRPEMVVAEEPISGDPAELLNQLLAPPPVSAAGGWW